MTDPVKKVHKRLLATDTDLCTQLRDLGSMRAVADYYGVGYQTITERFKSMRNDGLDIPKAGKRAPRTPEQIAALQAVLRGA